MSSLRRLADYLAAGLIFLTAPLFRAVARWPGAYPNYLRAADRVGVHLRSTHYYHPTYADLDLPSDVSGERHLPGLDLDPEGQLARVAAFDVASELSAFPEGSAEGLGFAFANGAYEHGDAESLYAMIRSLKPARLFEIGSGHSTRMAKAALDANRQEAPSYDCRHLCIEPYEMPWLDQLGIEVVRSRVEQCDPALFSELDQRDILFIDSSHVIRPFGDVLFEFQRLIPALSKGVFVHVHDVFTPRDYPESWLRKERRLWNEQYLMETMLSHSPRYRVALALNWLTHNHRERLDLAFPTMAGHQCEPGAFWFEIME